MKRATWKRLSALALSVVMVFTMAVGVFAEQSDNGNAPVVPGTQNSGLGALEMGGTQKRTVGDKVYEVYEDANGDKYLVDGEKVYDWEDPAIEVTQVTDAQLKDTGDTTKEKIQPDHDSEVTFKVYKDANGNPYYIHGGAIYRKNGDNDFTALTGDAALKPKDILKPVPDESDIKAAITKVIKTGVGTSVPQGMSFAFKFEQLDAVGIIAEYTLTDKDIATGYYTGMDAGDKLTNVVPHKVTEQEEEDGTYDPAKKDDVIYLNADTAKNYDSAGNEIPGFHPGKGTGDDVVAVSIPEQIVSVSAKMAEPNSGKNDKSNRFKTIAMQTEDFLNGVYFPAAGVYAFKVTEYVTTERDANFEATTTSTDSKTVAHTDRNADATTTVTTKTAKPAETINGIDYQAWTETEVQKLEYSKAEYVIYVYVAHLSEPDLNTPVYDTNGDNVPDVPKTTYVYGLGTVYTKDDDGKTQGTSGVNPAVGSKANPDPWEKPGDSYTGDHELTGEEMAFTNEYTKYKEGSPDPIDKPNPKQQQLAFSKKVTGTGADQSKYFTFDIELTRTASADDLDSEYLAYILNESDDIIEPKTDNYSGGFVDKTVDGKTYKAIKFEVDTREEIQETVENNGTTYLVYKSEDGTVTYHVDPAGDTFIAGNYENPVTGASNLKPQMIANPDFNKAKAQIGLKHNEHIAFLNIPVGTLFWAEEAAEKDYKPSAEIFVNNTSVTKEKEKNTALNTASETSTDTLVRAVGENVKNGADFTNEFKTPGITGILTENMGFFMMILAAIAVLVMVAVIRAKSRARMA